jgi:DNA replication and repair protein RecF
MSIELLTINHVRIIKRAEIQPSPSVNLITGPNAAGKTSLLEAIDILSRGRSFRTHLAERLVSSGQSELIVTARLHQSEGASLNIGLEKSRRGARIHIQESPAQSIAELASLLPVQVLHPESHQLIQGGPTYRRAYLDWGTFHVKRQFLPIWRRYQRSLHQRNAALKAADEPKNIRVWHGELSETGECIDNFRREYVHALTPVINEYVEKLPSVNQLTFSYQSGWPEAQSLAALLEREISADIQRGYTRYGPHRAELEIRVNGKYAHGIVSRGQQKLLAATMRLAQTRLFTQQTARACVILVDDLPAELERVYRERLLRALSQLDAQLFITAIEADDLNMGMWPDVKRFHVEQGDIQELV